jgi:hypothetical protein
MDLKHSFIIPPFINILEFTVGFRTMFLLHTFLQLWQYMLIILTWEFFINFSFFYRASAILQIKTNFMFGIFADSKEFIKYKFIRIIQYSTLLFSYCNRLVCFFIRKLI